MMLFSFSKSSVAVEGESVGVFLNFPWTPRKRFRIYGAIFSFIYFHMASMSSSIPTSFKTYIQKYHKETRNLAEAANIMTGNPSKGFVWDYGGKIRTEFWKN